MRWNLVDLFRIPAPSYVSAGADVKENSGYVTIRIPSEKFSEAMKQIQTFVVPSALMLAAREHIIAVSGCSDSDQ